MKKKRCSDGLSPFLQQNFRRMKLTIGLIIFTVFGTMAADLYSQTTKLSLEHKNEKVMNLLQSIENQSKYRFFFNEEVKLDFNVSVDLVDRPIEEVLDKIFENSNIRYEFIGRQIVLTNTTSNVSKQQKTVTGRVTDMGGQPLPGVTVLVKGTTTGIITDVDGNYTLMNVPGDAVLLFSFVGMKTTEVVLNNQSVVNITLEEETIGIEEVVAIGYGTQSRREITGSISSIAAEEIQGQPVPNMNSALQGRVAGVQIQQNSGMPGAGVNIRVRGVSSLGGSDPLYIIDGIPVETGNFSGLVGAGNEFSEDTGPSALSDLNPEDIESIQVLKDASATSIYGSRATNGVVIITTKRGKQGKAKINVNINSGVSWATHKYDLCNTEEYINVIKHSYTTSGLPGNSNTIDGSNENYSPDIYTDWQDEILRDAAQSKTANLSLQGGNENITYAVSLGYLNQDGIVIGSSFERFSGRTNVEYRASEKLKFGSNFSYSSSKSNPVESTGGGNSIIYRALAFSSPTQKLYNEDGSYWNKTRNVVQYANEIILESVANHVVGKFYLDFELLKGLKFQPSVAIDGLSMDEFLFYPSTLNSGSFNRTSKSVFTHNMKWINENLLTYKKDFGDNRLEVLAGYSLEERKYKRILVASQGGASDAIITSNGSSEMKDYSSFISESAITSLFSRVNYNLKDRYLLSASFRRDGSSRFGKEKRYGYFPSASIGWRISEENFFSNIKSVSDFKLRASWGMTGNQNIGDYQAQGVYAPGFDYDGIAGIAPSSNGFPNTKLTWETTTQFNLGADLSLFEGKISLYTDVYKKITDDILFDRTLPNTSGYTSMAANIGSMESSGFEFSISSYNINKSKFKWNTNFNFSTNKSIITSLPDGNDVILGGGYYYAILREGESVGSITTFVSDGLYKSQEEIDNAPKNTIYNSPITLGDIKYVDLNDDGKITSPEDRKIVGQMLPKFTGGLRNEFKYKDLTLDFLFQFSYGNKVYNYLRNDLNYKPHSNFDRAKLDAYDPVSNPDSNIPRNKIDNFRQNSHLYFLPTDIYLEDASYIRLKTVTLNYDLSTLLKGRFVKSINTYVTGQNLLTLTKYKGFDPESNNDLRQSYPGADRGAYPVSATLILGVNINF